MNKELNEMIGLKNEIAVEDNNSLCSEFEECLSKGVVQLLEILKKLDILVNRINEIEKNISLSEYILKNGISIYLNNSIEGQIGRYTITGKTLFKKNNIYTEKWEGGAILESIGEAEKNNVREYPIIIKNNGKNLINQGTNYVEIKNIFGLTHPYASKNGVKLVVGGNNRFICIKIILEENTFYTISCGIKNKSGTSKVLFYYILDGKDNYENELLVNLENKLAYKFKSSINGEYELKFYYEGAAKIDENCMLFNFQLEKGEKCTDYEEYMENKGVIFLDEPLRSVKDKADEIINNKIIRNIGARRYVQGDENLSDAITDRIMTIYELKKPLESNLEVLNVRTYNNITNITMDNKIKGMLKLELLVSSMNDENFNIKKIVIKLQNEIWGFNNALTDIKNKLSNATERNSVGIRYNNPLLKGAKGDGINDDSIYFNEEYNYLEEGKSFLINIQTARSLISSIGKGYVIIKDFPYEPKPSQPQGKFLIEYINDDVIMDMNLPNETIPNGAQPNQQLGGSFPFDDIKMPKDYEVLNPWGQVYIIEGESYPQNAILHIKNMALIVFRKSTQDWEIINDVNDIDGGYYYEDYRDQSIVPAEIRRYENEICVKIDSSTKGRCFHFWTSRNIIDDPEDILYVTVYVDAWVSGDNIENKFTFNVGADYKQSSSGSIREVISGRFKTIKTYPRRAYATNLNYNMYIKLCNQQIIDSLKVKKPIYDIASGNIMTNEIQYNPSFKKLLILKDKSKLLSKTIDYYAEINPFSKIYIPSRRDYGNENYYLKIGTFNVTQKESDACTINLEIFSDVQMSIYARMWINILKNEGESEIPKVTFMQINSYGNLTFSKRIFALINKQDNHYKVDLYLTNLPDWTPCHMYIDITAPRLDSFEFNEDILKPYSNYIDSPSIYWKNDNLVGTKVYFDN